jgi:diguanylate cyclase (GGDEF)-like protein
MSKQTACPTCGGSGVVTGDDPARLDEQTLADRDQTAGDQDQTWSDQDQTASDRDTDSSTEDQKASDRDFAAGGDPTVHERTRLARLRTAHDRDDVSTLRDESAAARLATAEERDRAAAIRDRQAADRDRQSLQRDDHPDASIAEIRLLAARNRAAAAADRARAAGDREAAARERAEARRVQAEVEQEALAAATDELTGTWTRGFGLAQITREIERAERTGSALTLAFIDIDNLKEVNDRQGHAAGDELLRTAAETLRRDLRPYDLVVRYGGDEFLCVMPNISKDAAAERMNSVASALSRAETGHSITYGLAEHRPGEGLGVFIARADSDLLASRRRGE